MLELDWGLIDPSELLLAGLMRELAVQNKPSSLMVKLMARQSLEW